MREEIVPGPEPQPPIDMTGTVVSFDLRRTSGKLTRESGAVTACVWLGRTARGLIPEYEVVIEGKTGVSVKARVTEDHVQPVEFRNQNPNPTPNAKYRTTKPSSLRPQIR